jgi:hypothetical protein
MHTTGTTAAPRPAAARTARVCSTLALALVAYFVASVAGFYQTDAGFTAFIGFSGGHDYEVPAMAGVPHAHIGGGYDGQFYAQLALVPLLKDPAIDRALDNPAYRARRILFSWTAYAAGLGRPAWVLQAYALQNVICWLLLAWLLTRWIPPTTPRRLALWAACLFGQGLLASVRLALTDGPSLLLLASAVAAAERRRLWTLSAVLGIGGLARETNLFGLTLLPRPRTLSQGIATALAVVVAAAPLLIWQDYLFSIYRSMTFANQNQLAMPFDAFFFKWETTVQGVLRDGVRTPHMLALAATLGLTAQAVYLVISVRRHAASAWWRLAAPYVVLMCGLDFAVWGGYPGAATRVLLPMTIAFNVLLDAEGPARFWPWYIAGNAALLYAADVLRP